MNLLITEPIELAILWNLYKTLEMVFGYFILTKIPRTGFSYFSDPLSLSG